MSIIGWYYLHTNGELLFKRELGGTAADIRESDFARALWPMDPTDRAGAWRILVESLAAGALRDRVQELAERWHCDEADAVRFAAHIGLRLERDGDQIVAARQDFVNLQESPVGFGASALEAMADLAKALGYTPSKMWGATFSDLVGVEQTRMARA